MPVPSIGFRFYSSTDYFSIPPCTTGLWHDLSLKNWESLETELTERIDQAAASASAALPGDGEDGEEENAGKSSSKVAVRRGPRSAGDGMARVLEEVATLFAWDRPQLYSPVKGEAGKAKMGNSVFLLTSLPPDLAGVNTEWVTEIVPDTFSCFIPTMIFKSSHFFQSFAKKEGSLLKK